MNPIFADVGYWIALLYKSDFLHQEAVRASKSLDGRLLVTSELVLTELLDGAANKAPFARAAAVNFVGTLPQREGILIIPMSSQLFKEAFALYSQRMDKGWSLTDCASMVICRHQGITDVLAHDRHFEQAGFRALLRENA